VDVSGRVQFRKDKRYPLTMDQITVLVANL
jgi:hypothetical protein